MWPFQIDRIGILHVAQVVNLRWLETQVDNLRYRHKRGRDARISESLSIGSVSPVRARGAIIGHSAHQV